MPCLNPLGRRQRSLAQHSCKYRLRSQSTNFFLKKKMELFFFFEYVTQVEASLDAAPHSHWSDRFSARGTNGNIGDLYPRSTLCQVGMKRPRQPVSPSSMRLH